MASLFKVQLASPFNVQWLARSRFNASRSIASRSRFKELATEPVEVQMFACSIIRL
jgi:hypothetical protein